MQNESWRERFTEIIRYSPLKAYEDTVFNSVDVYNDFITRIESFVASELNLAKQEEHSQLLQEIEERLEKTYGDGSDSALVIITPLEGVVEQKPALKEVLTIINSLK